MWIAFSVDFMDLLHPFSRYVNSINYTSDVIRDWHTESNSHYNRIQLDFVRSIRAETDGNEFTVPIEIVASIAINTVPNDTENSMAMHLMKSLVIALSISFGQWTHFFFCGSDNFSLIWFFCFLCSHKNLD